MTARPAPLSGEGTKPSPFHHDFPPGLPLLSFQGETMMTKDELKRYRDALEAKSAELDRSSRRRDGILIERAADSLDSVLLAEERDLAVIHLAAGSNRLREVRDALRRIED